MRHFSALATAGLLALMAGGCALEPDASLIGTMRDPLRRPAEPTLPAYATPAPLASPGPLAAAPQSPGTAPLPSQAGPQRPGAAVAGAPAQDSLDLAVAAGGNPGAQPAASSVLDPVARQRALEELSGLAGRGQVGGPRTSKTELMRIRSGHGAAALADIEGR
ncbi:hypothetical protein GWI72_07665 [Microvirga tunisiensis]|uniref:DUF3035 domain-containing protein n=1 Tax=Pannonibacter tanglangensis TaxID=2750084 RepID=A0A7X5F1N7_9HYPH|nr:hypothetical protein [Pannonibacter sp. XCT-53]